MDRLVLAQLHLRISIPLVAICPISRGPHASFVPRHKNKGHQDSLEACSCFTATSSAGWNLDSAWFLKAGGRHKHKIFKLEHDSLTGTRQRILLTALGGFSG